MPLKNVVLLETGMDCCMVTALFKEEQTGMWNIGAVKHAHCWNNAMWMGMSPLYRLSSVNENSIKNDKDILLTVSNFLKANPNRGSVLWDQIIEIGTGLTDCEVENLCR